MLASLTLTMASFAAPAPVAPAMVSPLPAPVQFKQGRKGKKGKKAGGKAGMKFPEVGGGVSMGLEGGAAGIASLLGGAAGKKAAGPLPTFALERLEMGPLSRAQAAELARQLGGYGTINLLTDSDLSLAPPAPARDENDEPALATLVLSLAERDGVSFFDPVADPATVTPLDNRHLLIWFGGLDRDGDGFIRFFEFRDATNEGLEVFEALDLNSDGGVSFEEFAGPVVLVAERASLDVHESLLQFVDASPAALDPALGTGHEPIVLRTAIESRRLEQVVARARSALEPHRSVGPSDPLSLSNAGASPSGNQPLSGDRLTIANTLAERLYPMPPPRAAVSGLWVDPEWANRERGKKKGKAESPDAGAADDSGSSEAGEDVDSTKGSR